MPARSKSFEEWISLITTKDLIDFLGIEVSNPEFMKISSFIFADEFIKMIEDSDIKTKLLKGLKSRYLETINGSEE